jgi:hypothetical protein
MFSDTGTDRHELAAASTNGDQGISTATGTQQFREALAKCLGSDVLIAPGCLPGACVSLWIGLEDADLIEFNPGWPSTAIDLVAHTAGHLMLGHCGHARNGRQFACVVGGDADPGVRAAVQAVLPDSDGVPAPLFSDREEHQAERFASLLLGRLGLTQVLMAPVFACIG